MYENENEYSLSYLNRWARTIQINSIFLKLMSYLFLFYMISLVFFMMIFFWTIFVYWKTIMLKEYTLHQKKLYILPSIFKNRKYISVTDFKAFLGLILCSEFIDLLFSTIIRQQFLQLHESWLFISTLQCLVFL